MKHTEALNQLVTNLNSLRGYSNRYRLVAAFDRTPGEPRKVALVKAIGKQDLNVSGWRTPEAMLGWLDGWMDGWATNARVTRRERPVLSFSDLNRA